MIPVARSRVFAKALSLALLLIVTGARGVVLAQAPQTPSRSTAVDVPASGSPGGTVDTLPTVVRPRGGEPDVPAAPIQFYLRNNRGWFRSVTIVVYEPGHERPTVDARTMLPLQRSRLDLPVGSKVYIATQDQIQLIKDGKDLRRFPASLTVRADDAGQVYPIFK